MCNSRINALLMQIMHDHALWSNFAEQTNNDDLVQQVPVNPVFVPIDPLSIVQRDFERHSPQCCRTVHAKLRVSHTTRDPQLFRIQIGKVAHGPSLSVLTIRRLVGHLILR